MNILPNFQKNSAYCSKGLIETIVMILGNIIAYNRIARFWCISPDSVGLQETLEFKYVNIMLRFSAQNIKLLRTRTFRIG